MMATHAPVLEGDLQTSLDPVAWLEGASGMSLGRVLSRRGLVYASVPHEFQAFAGSPRVRHLLQVDDGEGLFGRRTNLCAGGAKLGDIVEVLPRYDRQRWSPRIGQPAGGEPRRAATPE